MSLSNKINLMETSNVQKASNFQKVVMSIGYRGKEIFKPLNTGWIDDRTACVREWIANIFFYTKNGTTIMIDAGYNYERLKEKMRWLGIEPSSIKHGKAGIPMEQLRHFCRDYKEES